MFAVGHNLRLVLAWLRILLCLIMAALRSALRISCRDQIGFLTADDIHYFTVQQKGMIDPSFILALTAKSSTP
jgi:hypothetical protein